ERASLASRADGMVAVHALVSRTTRFSDDHPERTRALRAAVVSALNTVLPAVTDVRQHASIALEVLHGRDLSCLNMEDTETATLATWVAHHDFVRGAFGTARTLHEQVLATRRRILGDEHPDTLTAMGNLATSLSAQGDVAGARTLQEQVLATFRRIL